MSTKSVQPQTEKKRKAVAPPPPAKTTMELEREVRVWERQQQEAREAIVRDWIKSQEKSVYR